MKAKLHEYKKPMFGITRATAPRCAPATRFQIEPNMKENHIYFYKNNNNSAKKQLNVSSAHLNLNLCIFI